MLQIQPIQLKLHMATQKDAKYEKISLKVQNSKINFLDYFYLEFHELRFLKIVQLIKMKVILLKPWSGVKKDLKWMLVKQAAWKHNRDQATENFWYHLQFIR